jgi:hypothetical protein
MLGGPSASDYYAKQANPKDGGYAKSNYIKGDGTRILLDDVESLRVDIKARQQMARTAGRARKRT